MVDTNIINKVRGIIDASGFTVEQEDLGRPWGGFIRLADSDAEKFINAYFDDSGFVDFTNLSPKFLLVSPGQRLSWQKHSRRGEVWRVLNGPVGVKISDKDTEPEEVDVLYEGNFIEFDSGVRHRLIGLESWGVVAEIWRHTDPLHLSDEDDIVRIQDDYKR